MATFPGEIVDGLVSALESPAVQAELLSAITNGEKWVEAALDTVIANAKVGGVLGVVVAATKGSLEGELNAEFAAFPPATIAAWLTKLAQEEAKALGG